MDSLLGNETRQNSQNVDTHWEAECGHPLSRFTDHAASDGSLWTPTCTEGSMWTQGPTVDTHTIDLGWVSTVKATFESLVCVLSL